MFWFMKEIFKFAFEKHWTYNRGIGTLQTNACGWMRLWPVQILPGVRPHPTWTIPITLMSHKHPQTYPLTPARQCFPFFSLNKGSWHGKLRGLEFLLINWLHFKDNLMIGYIIQKCSHGQGLPTEEMYGLVGWILGYPSTVQGPVFHADCSCFIFHGTSESRASFLITPPVQSYRAPCSEGSVFGLCRICSCCLEILSTFWTRSPAFSFVTGPVS